MQLVQLIIPAESARLAVSNLGDLGLVQFKDVSTHLCFLDFNRFAPIPSCARGRSLNRVRLLSVCDFEAVIIKNGDAYSPVHNYLLVLVKVKFCKVWLNI
jgi:hypothetical protein